MRRFLKRLQLKNSPTWKRKQSSPRGGTSPILDKPKEKHTKAHTNQTNKDQTQIKNIKSSKGEAASNMKMGNTIHLTADLSAETLQARREWKDIFKVLKGKNLQPRSLYPARISFKIDGENKNFQTNKS